MNRIDYIENYIENKRLGDNSILYALIRCLDPKEKFDLFRQNYLRNYVLRDAVLYVFNELSEIDHVLLFNELVQSIIRDFPNLPANQRSSAIFCLGKLCQKTDSETRKQILNLLLTSKYVAGRRKALKLISEHEIVEFSSLIEACVWNHKDQVAIALLIKHFPAHYLYDKRDALVGMLDAGWALARLYIRASEYNASCISELKSLDGITYSYVMAKLGKQITQEEAEQLLEQYRLDERLGLLVWAFGKMGLWRVLTRIAEHSEQWMLERFSDKSRHK